MRKQYEREGTFTDSKELPRSSTPPQRPQAMRAWLNKWDPEFNTGFRQVGSQTEVPNN